MGEEGLMKREEKESLDHAFLFHFSDLHYYYFFLFSGLALKGRRKGDKDSH